MSVLLGEGGVPACLEGEGKHNLGVGEEKAGLGENQGEEEEPLWGGKLVVSVSHLAISAVRVLGAAGQTVVFGHHGYRPTLRASG